MFFFRSVLFIVYVLVVPLQLIKFPHINVLFKSHLLSADKTSPLTYPGQPSVKYMNGDFFCLLATPHLFVLLRQPLIEKYQWLEAENSMWIDQHVMSLWYQKKKHYGIFMTSFLRKKNHNDITSQTALTLSLFCHYSTQRTHNESRWCWGTEKSTCRYPAKSYKQTHILLHTFSFSERNVHHHLDS